jgi:hypothetical protein
VDLDEIRRRLRDNVRTVTEALLGDHNKALSSRNVWRWGSTGKMVVFISGQKLGACKCFADEWKGDLFNLIERERHCDFKEAIDWAARFLGIDTTTAYQPDAADQQRQQKREHKRRKAAADDADDEARRIGRAQALWSQRVADPADTLGYHYVLVGRRIPLGWLDWPHQSASYPPAGIAGPKKQTASKYGRKSPTPQH